MTPPPITLLLEEMPFEVDSMAKNAFYFKTVEVLVMRWLTIFL